MAVIVRQARVSASGAETGWGSLGRAGGLKVFPPSVRTQFSTEKKGTSCSGGGWALTSQQPESWGSQGLARGCWARGGQKCW